MSIAPGFPFPTLNKDLQEYFEMVAAKKPHPCEACLHRTLDECEAEHVDTTDTGHVKRVIRIKEGVTPGPRYEHVYQFYCQGAKRRTLDDIEAEKRKRK